VECGRKLGFFEGYRHPTMGSKQTLCSSCYNVVSESIEKWSEAVLSYNGFFKHTATKYKNRFNLIKISNQVTHG
jgi:hypothetical protein